MKVMNTKLEYTVHQQTNRLMVKVIDRKEDTIIKEIPSEKMLDLVAKIQEGIGVLVDERI